jgi:Poly (ADP-ribose) glycohydrolase (PARG)
VEIRRLEEKIEDEEESIHVDFANAYIGGGVLGHGCV